MSQAPKRVIDQDPDYESIPLHTQQKRIKLHEQDAKEAAVRKIEQIVRSQFSNEISAREAELDLINQRIYQAQVILDRLRVGIITKYYAGGGNAVGDNCGAGAAQGGWHDSQQALASIHPTTRQYLGKAPPPTTGPHQMPSGQDEAHRSQAGEQRTPLTLVASDSSAQLAPSLMSHNTEPSKKERATANGESSGTTAVPRIGRGPRCKTKVRVIVGNVSKYIPLDRRDGGSGEQATHKWLAYVRTAPGEARSIGELVRRVRFFLHPSYRPHDLVEVTEAPFQVQRKGWGEFPLRVQLHFHDRWTKHVDIIHHLKLDKTYTGLQTLGAETVVDLWLPSSATGLPETSSGADVDARPSGGSQEKVLAKSERTESAESIVSSADKAETEPPTTTSEGIAITANDIESPQCTSETRDVETLPIALLEPSSSQTCAAVETLGQKKLDGVTVVDDHKQGGMPCTEQQALVNTTTSAMLDRNKPTNVTRHIATSARAAVLATPPVSNAMTLPVCAPVTSFAPPKLLLPKSSAMTRQNGVISTSFVKCTDALGRVLLIPATSLLSPPPVPGKQQAAVPKQPSLLQPATAVTTALSGLPIIAPGTSSAARTTKTVCLVADPANKPAAGFTNLRTSAVGTTAVLSGAPQASTGSAVVPQQGVLPSKAAGKASLVALAPAGVPGLSGVLASNILTSAPTPPLLPTGSHKMASAGLVPNNSNNAGVKILPSIGPATSAGVVPSALRVIRPALPSATASASLAGSQSTFVIPNSAAGLVHVTPVSPVVRPSVVPAATNRTSLLSVVCNKPGVVDVNAAAPVLSATTSALPTAAAVTNKANAASVICSRTVSQTADAAALASSGLSTMSSAPTASSTPGVSTYTFVMLPGQNQIMLLPASTVNTKDTPTRPVAVQEKPSLLPPAPSGSQTTIVSPAAVLQGQPEKVDLAKELRERLDSIRLSECRDMREALFAVAVHFPLVGVSVDEKSSCFPYAASDSATFFSWPLPKRRASEWMRACDVRRALERLIECKQPAWFSPSSTASNRGLPSRRSIVLVCRRFGFTPLHPDADSKTEEAERSGVESCEHNSYSEPSELISRLADAASAVEDGVKDGACDGEEEVDVDGLDAEEPDITLQPSDASTSASEQGPTASTVAAATPHSSSSPEKCLLRKAKVHLPLSPAAAFVREAAAEVGIHLTGCELEPRIDVPVVEEMMVSACKNFATALLRRAVDMAFKRTRPDRTPSSVTLEDTYQGILNLRECSFLTNENLGIETARESDESHV